VFFVAPKEVIEDLFHSQNLLKHKYPTGQMANVFGDGLKLVIEKPPQVGKTERKQAPSRMQPRWVRRRIRRRVWERDEEQCAFISADGHRCEERGGLEFDHAIAWADGGKSDDENEIRLLCQPHKRWLARQRFGEKANYRKNLD
jgi:hypothetical protein